MCSSNVKLPKVGSYVIIHVPVGARPIKVHKARVPSTEGFTQHKNIFGFTQHKNIFSFTQHKNMRWGL